MAGGELSYPATPPSQPPSTESMEDNELWWWVCVLTQIKAEESRVIDAAELAAAFAGCCSCPELSFSNFHLMGFPKINLTGFVEAEEETLKIFTTTYQKELRNQEKLSNSLNGRTKMRNEVWHKLSQNTYHTSSLETLVSFTQKGMGKTIQVYGFPSYVTAEVVKEFVEDYTGKGTVYALEIPKRKTKERNPRVFANVQFTSNQYAEFLTSLINQRLYYGNSYLKVRDRARDIKLKPRDPILRLKVPALHLGCQVSRERFLVFWNGLDVAVEFGFGFRKLNFLLSYCGVDYKLELSYEGIWQIQLRRPESQSTRFLLIQMLGAPKIYRKLLCPSNGVFGDPLLHYFMDESDDHWVRVTDFTPSCCIGQSSAMCWEIPYSCELPDFRENFPYYKEDKGRFILLNGSTFSQISDLVPIVGSPREVELPFEILFKISSLVQNGCLAGPTLDLNFFRLVDPCLLPINHIKRALETLYHLRECCYDPVKWLNEQYTKYRTSNHSLKSPTVSLDDGLVYVRRVQVTPSKVYFCGPEVNVSNRVLRHYRDDIDNFIRISFVDEDLERMHSTDLSTRTVSIFDKERHTELYKRILSTLQNGMVIGDKKFDFLAFSASQLRDNSAWMFASRGSLTAARIREWIGDFSDIRNVAKYAARLGQSFGSSTETLNVGRHEIEMIPDVEIESNGAKYVFSDGIGKISLQFAQKVAIKCGMKSSTTSAFQIRYGGYKGVVAVDPTSEMKLSLRKSMCKFMSPNTKLDVLAWSKYQPCFLNRQVITLLSTLGVGDYVFENKQKEAINELDLILTDPLRAHEALEVMSPGENTNILKEMLSCGYKPDEEPFLSMMLQTFRASKLFELRTRARIFVPKGRSLMGCLDETRTLDYGQVFIQVSSIGSKQCCEDSHFIFSENGSDNNTFVVIGKVVIAKNPCLHPGDMRVLRAVNVPALHHMVDCVVFPQKGKRPHPNECSGSDLDGDIYFVSWDLELIPPRQVEPMDYAAPPSMLLDHNVRIEEVEEYFANYMINDSLGVIANTHTAFADKEPLMAESDQCIELAKLFSIAVDFPKTGVPAEIPPHLRVQTYPDFMEKLDKPTYESKRVIGKLFREVKDIPPYRSCIKSFTREVAEETYDPGMEYKGFEEYLDDAYYYKGEYDFKLGNLMGYYGIKTEAEIFSGCIMKLSKSFNVRRDLEAIGLQVRSLRKEARKWFDDNSSISGFQDDDNMHAKASAWYHVTYHPNYWGCYNDGMNRAHFLSFPWCVYDKLIHIKRMNMKRKRNVMKVQRLS